MIKEWVDKLTIKRQARHFPAVLGENRIYILPTHQGVLFFALLLAMLLGSINFNNNLGFLFTFLLGCMTFISLIHTHRNLKGLVLQSAQIAPVFAGEKAMFVLTLKPGTEQRPGICLGFKGEEEIEVSLNRSVHQVCVPIATHGRGLFKTGVMTLSSSYPLGLFRAWSTINPDSSYLVYPRPVYGPFQPGTGAEPSENEGAIEIKGTDDFKELRRYQPGDPLSRLSWKSFSKGRGLHTKEFSIPAGEIIILSWDQVHENDIETKLARLCDMIQHAHRMNLSYGLSLPGTEIPPADPKDPAHYHRCLQALALFNGGGI